MLWLNLYDFPRSLLLMSFQYWKHDGVCIVITDTLDTICTIFCDLILGHHHQMILWCCMNHDEPMTWGQGRLRISTRHCALLSCQNTCLFQNHEWDWENTVSWTIYKVTHLVGNSIVLHINLVTICHEQSTNHMHAISNVEGSMTITAERFHWDS